MAQTKITPEVLETNLRLLRSGKPPEPAILAMTGHTNPVAEKNYLAFESLIYDLTWEVYTGLRQAEGLATSKPENRQGALQQIHEDFRIQNGDLAAWSALYGRYLSGLNLSVHEMAQAASVVPQQFRRRLKQGLALLAQRLTRRAIEADQAPARLASLPLPDFTSLVGVQAYIDLLTQLFSRPDGPRLVSLEGIGGIGKSALAHAFIGLPETTNRWAKIVWVSARQTLLAEDGRLTPVTDPVTTLEDITTRLCDQLGFSSVAAQPLAQRIEVLKTVLAQEKHMVVIDNLETVSEYLRLVPTLGELAGVSRFIITTRQSLREFPYVHTVTIKELDREQAFQLIETETARRGRRNPVTAENFAELYQVIGGHPQALKLVAAQLYLRPFSEILNGFRQASGGIDSLYRFLYWQTWHSLHDSARRLLLSFLPTDPEGEDLAFLQIMSEQKEEEFYLALKELDQFSLLEVNGDAERPLYRLHSLTATFLRTDILRFWGGERGA